MTALPDDVTVTAQQAAHVAIQQSRHAADSSHTAARARLTLVATPGTSDDYLEAADDHAARAREAAIHAARAADSATDALELLLRPADSPATPEQTVAALRNVARHADNATAAAKTAATAAAETAALTQKGTPQ